MSTFSPMAATIFLAVIFSLIFYALYKMTTDKID